MLWTHPRPVQSHAWSDSRGWASPLIRPSGHEEGHSYCEGFRGPSVGTSDRQCPVWLSESVPERHDIAIVGKTSRIRAGPGPPNRGDLALVRPVDPRALTGRLWWLCGDAGPLGCRLP